MMRWPHRRHRRHRARGPAVTSPASWGYDTARHRREMAVRDVLESDYLALCREAREVA